MRKVLIVLSVLLSLSWTFAVTRAQEALTQTVTADDGSFSIMIPDGWGATTDVGRVSVLNPDATTSTNFVIQDLTGSVKDAVGQLLAHYGAPASVEISEQQIGGRSGALAQYADGNRSLDLIGVDAGGGKVLLAITYAASDAVTQIHPTLVAIAGSYQSPPGSGSSAAAPTTAPDSSTQGDALTQTYTAADGSYSFMYPADWPVQVDGTNISILTPDASMSANFQVLPLAGSAKDALTTYLAGFNHPDNVQVSDLQLGGHPAALAQYVEGDTSGDILVVDSGSGKMLQMVVYSPTDAVEKAHPTLLAIAASFQSPAGGGAAIVPTVDASTAIVPAVNGVSTIAFGSYDRGYADLFTTDPAGTNVTQFTQQQLSALQPAFSPDGTMLAYIANTPTDSQSYDVFVAPAGGGEARKLTAQPSTDRGAVAWSPDSKQLLFLATRSADDKGNSLYEINADGSGEQKLALDAQAVNAFVLDWSPDGQHIALMAFPNGGPDYALLIANPDGSGLTPIPGFQPVQVGEFFRWSPDGQHALISDTSSLTVTSADGSAPQVILDKSAGWTISGVDWSPDGTQIAFAGLKSPDTALGLYLINADGSNLQKVDLGAREVTFAALAWGTVASGAAAPTEAPAVEPTTASAPAASCTIAAKGTANLRGGPGTTFAKAGTLAAGVTQSVTGQAQGADGFVWYQLDGGNWVRSDLVNSNGDCASVPTVSP